MDISQMTVFVPNPIHAAAVAKLKEKVKVVLWDDPAIANWHEEADAIILRVNQARKADFPLCKKLKVICKHGIGVDTIDVADAKAAGIKVVYTPYENVESVAELAVSLMMTLSRSLYPGNIALRAGTKMAQKDLVGVELLGKTLGIIGLGRIGRRVGSILNTAFGMNVLGFDPFLPDAAWSTIPFNTKKCDAIEDLIAGSDYITIHVPLTDQTRNLIDAPQFGHFRPGAILVNTARGGIINEDALYNALKAGKLRGAGSDVFTAEPPPKEHPLLGLDNFIGMPHVGASTEDSLYRMGMTSAEEVLAALEGGEVRYYVP